MAEPVETEPAAGSGISWPRAVISAVVIAVVGLGLLAYGTNTLVTKLTSVGRGARVGIATTYFFVVLCGIAFTLRRLQRRGIL